MIDFGRLSAQLSKGKITDPTEIFMSLPSKNEKYSYLRNVQAEVLEQWYDQRDRKNNIIHQVALNYKPANFRGAGTRITGK